MRTRKQKTLELLNYVTCGPSLSLDVFGVANEPKLTKAQAAEIDANIKSWLSTWVEPLVRELLAKELS